jgi:hypothetical protein
MGRMNRKNTPPDKSNLSAIEDAEVMSNRETEEQRVRETEKQRNT